MKDTNCGYYKVFFLNWLTNRPLMGLSKVLIVGLLLGLTPLGSGDVFAQNKGKSKVGARQKHINSEKTVRSRDTTKLDFDAADIGGARKAPMGSFLNQNKADKEYDFVKIRQRWTPEMVQSSSSLDTGKSK